MKIERKIIFTEAEEAAVKQVEKMLEELVEVNEISDVCLDYNPADSIALDELWGLILDFKRFVEYTPEWKIVDYKE